MNLKLVLNRSGAAASGPGLRLRLTGRRQPSAPGAIRDGVARRRPGACATQLRLGPVAGSIQVRVTFTVTASLTRKIFQIEVLPPSPSPMILITDWHPSRRVGAVTALSPASLAELELRVPLIRVNNDFMASQCQSYQWAQPPGTLPVTKSGGLRL